MPDRSQILAQIPSKASISFIKWPFPTPPKDGLHDISPAQIKIIDVDQVP